MIPPTCPPIHPHTHLLTHPPHTLSLSFSIFFSLPLTRSPSHLDWKNEIEHNVHEILIRLDARQRDIHNSSLSLLCQGLNETCLAGAGGTPQQHAQLVGETLHGVLARAVLEAL